MCNMYLIVSILLTITPVRSINLLNIRQFRKLCMFLFRGPLVILRHFLLFPLVTQMQPEFKHEDVSYIGTVWHNKEAKI